MIGSARIGAVVLGLAALAGCHPGSRQADACAAPPPWRQLFAKPGQPDAELWACLQEKAYAVHAVHIPNVSRRAGLIAQCEVGVDQFEGNMHYLGADASEQERARVEQRAQQLAAAAIAQYQACPAQ